MSCKDKRNRSSDAESKEILESVRKYQKSKVKSYIIIFLLIKFLPYP
ncbi:hypothetical protein HET73_07505 [Wolbachia endosymbiont of Atemnus politus]|nr:hypothetical protein [Wolbachia endosymbiont of Atemnus politus]